MASRLTAQESCEDGETRIRFSSHETGDDGSPKSLAAQRLVDLINARFDGAYCVEHDSEGARFANGAVIGAMQRGDLELAVPSLGAIAGIAPPFQVFSLPFVFRDAQALHWFQQTGPGARLRRSVARAGLVGLAYWNQGMRQLSATRTIRRPEDLRRLRIRVSGLEIQRDTYRMFGARGRRIAFEKVAAALANGQVDGQENTWRNILNQRFYVGQDGVTETNHSVILSVLIASERFWSSLSLSDRAIFSSIVAEVTKAQQSEWVDIENEARGALEASGVEVRRLSDTERALWIEAVQPLWRRYERRIGARLIQSAARAGG